MQRIRLLKVVIATCALSLFSAVNPAIANGSLDTTCATGGVCAIGDTGPGGGVVFFVKSSYTNTSVSTQNGTRTTSLTSQELAALPFDYLEAAPIGWDASSATDASRTRPRQRRRNRTPQRTRPKRQNKRSEPTRTRVRSDFDACRINNAIPIFPTSKRRVGER